MSTQADAIAEQRVESPARREAVRALRVAAFLSVLSLAVNTVDGLWHAVAAGAIGAFAAVFLGAAVLVAVPFYLRQWAITAYRSLTDLPFAIAALSLLALVTMVGTWVHEPRSPEVFFGRHGAIAPVMAWLHLDDVFRATWYRTLVGLVAASLCASVAARRAWRYRQLGFLLSHAGAVSIVMGGALGTWFGSRGVIQLGVGETVKGYLGTKGQEHALPFAFRLEGFETVRGPEILRLYETDGRSRVFAVHRADAGTKGKVGGGVVFNVVSASKGPKGPQVELVLGPQPGRHVTLARDGSSSVEVGNGRQLKLATRGDDVEDFVSTFSLVDGERVVGGKTSVNQPFVYEGYRFYQASYDAKDARQSGVLVVRDPGLGLSKLGLALMVLGVFHILFLRRLARGGRNE
ncbi:MAG: cytochrome c biogenesis protein ResB [Deltaproteobacteria bacterium]|nr:cytochrome c biogenesis protein ResB [Deltaproteobacteria bacterium]